MSVLCRGLKVGAGVGRTTRWTLLKDLERLGVRLVRGARYRATLLLDCAPPLFRCLQRRLGARHVRHRLRQRGLGLSQLALQRSYPLSLLFCLHLCRGQRLIMLSIAVTELSAQLGQLGLSTGSTLLRHRRR